MLHIHQQRNDIRSLSKSFDPVERVQSLSARFFAIDTKHGPNADLQIPPALPRESPKSQRIMGLGPRVKRKSLAAQTFAPRVRCCIGPTSVDRVRGAERPNNQGRNEDQPWLLLAQWAVATASTKRKLEWSLFGHQISALATGAIMFRVLDLSTTSLGILLMTCIMEDSAV